MRRVLACCALASVSAVESAAVSSATNGSFRLLAPPPPLLTPQAVAALTSPYSDPINARLPHDRWWDTDAWHAGRVAAEALARARRLTEWSADSFWTTCFTPSPPLPNRSCDPLSSYIWGYFQPDAPCPIRTRVGAVHDGGKFVCGAAEQKRASSCTVYSFGVADDVSFEAEMLRDSNCTVFAFDPTVPAAPSIKDAAKRAWAFEVARREGVGVSVVPHILEGEGGGGASDASSEAAASVAAAAAKRFVFNKLGIAASSFWREGSPYAALPSIMETLGHEFVDILKVDVEGAEWDALIPVFHAWAQAGVTPISQLLVELHAGGVPPWKVATFFDAAAGAGLVPFSSELNPITCIPHSALPRRPDFIEYSFVHIGNVRTRLGL